ncbi:MAG: acyl-CoA dehydratase activase [bacterium]|nr:acyl-CoA dehydratase activase [bacterium]
MSRSKAVWGMDLGSREVKIVLMGEGREIRQMESYETIAFYRRCRQIEPGGGLRIEDESIGPAKNLGYPVVTTGYGRNSLCFENSYQIPEIMAHALGACYLSGLSDFILVDIGGQDSKVALVEQGKVSDFVMNDKCAASSGRYLENMARVLGVSLEELGRYAENPVELDSTCAIFGESELIGKLVEGASLSSLCAGVNFSVFRRLAPMLSQFSGQVILLSGGVSRNAAIQQIIRENCKPRQVVVLPHSQFVGAIGCAYWYLLR